VHSSADFEGVFGEAEARRVQALYIVSDSGVINANYGRIADLALHKRLPSIGAFRPYVEAGGLMSYGPSLTALYARAGYYVDRILRGAPPGDLPIEQPSVFEFPVNVKTAQALGIAFPPDVAAQVTEWLQ
jgi:putative tryptophan/tyrosine transport system substrate-binding protein